jgi:hypothetical protein
MASLSNRIPSRSLNHYLGKNRHRRSEEDQGLDDPFVPCPDSAYVETNTWYMLPGKVPARGPGGFINGGHGP